MNEKELFNVIIEQLKVNYIKLNVTTRTHLTFNDYVKAYFNYRSNHVKENEGRGN